MTQEQFIYWLQGFVEVHGEHPTSDQWKIIKDHLKTVFHKVTPDYDFGKQNTPYTPPSGAPYNPPPGFPNIIC